MRYFGTVEKDSRGHFAAFTLTDRETNVKYRFPSRDAVIANGMVWRFIAGAYGEEYAGGVGWSSSFDHLLMDSSVYTTAYLLLVDETKTHPDGSTFFEFLHLKDLYPLLDNNPKLWHEYTEEGMEVIIREGINSHAELKAYWEGYWNKTEKRKALREKPFEIIHPEPA